MTFPAISLIYESTVTFKLTIKSQCLALYCQTLTLYYASVGWQSPLEAYSSRRTCVCVSVSFCKILFTFSLQLLNIKDWNVQCKLNAMLS